MTEKKTSQTEKIFEKDSTVSVFEAKVIFCEEKNGKFRIVLDKTAFFPTGGGQTCDTGTLDDAKISDVFIEDGEIIHISSREFPVGQIVTGKLDYTDRLNKMRSHTAEHILSAYLFKTKGFTNVGFHLGSNDTTCDFDGTLTDDELDRAEDYVNSIIMEDLPVYPSFPNENELLSLSYRSKLELEGDIRIVNIGRDGNIDKCACCAPHVTTTGQIGIFRIIDSYHYKGGTRIHILTGLSALRRCREESRGIRTLSAKLSAKPYASDVISAVERLSSELSGVKVELNFTRQTLSEAYGSRAELNKPFILTLPEADGDLVKRIALSAKDHGASVAVVFGGASDCRFAILGDRSAEIFNALKTEFSARGGGKDIICGSITNFCENGFFEKLGLK